MYFKAKKRKNDCSKPEKMADNMLKKGLNNYLM
jgi:hypothetical protein